MGNRNFNQVESVFHVALGLPPDQRGAYLAQACAGNNSLYAEVCSLVSASETSNDFMAEPALNLGLNVLSAIEVESMTGKTIGSYRVLSRLGKGGMGEVYLAEDTRLGRKVALKFLSQELVGDNWAKRQLIKEAQAVAMLDHPNICSVYDFEESGEHNFIVMQFIEGETLADLIRQKKIETDRVRELTRQIAAALAEAHAHGIIHRDVKPRNIMVTRDGQAKVLDFGLAKTIKQKDERELAEKSTSHLARNGILAGTVSYMSPEQLRGERLDFRSDIFSLGAVIYEVIGGRHPFLRASEAETISAILTSDPPPIKHANGFEKVVRQCLAKDREKRYQSASELLLELSNSTMTPRKFDQFFRPPTILSAALVLILLTTVVTFLYLNRPRAIPSSSANTQPIPNTYVYSLAVMPITSSNPLKSGDYLTEGLTDSLIAKFSSLQQVRVIPYEAISGYRDKTIDPKSVGTELKVDALLFGHIVQQGNKQILQSRLIKVSDGSEIPISEMEIKWRTILEVPDELAKSVTRILELRFQDEKKFFETHGTLSPEAFRHYMQGRYFWRMRDKDNLKKAIHHFEEATRLDITYARAHAGLADSYVLLNVVAFGETPTDEAMSKAAYEAREALIINPTLPEAHTSLGVINLRYAWKWNEAEQNFKQAMLRDDAYAPAHYWYSQLLLVTHRWEEAVAESEKAKRLDPFSHPTVMNFCRTLSLSRQYERALGCYDELVAENSKFDHGKYLRALVLQRSGRYDEALAELESVYSRNRPLAAAALGYAYGRAGKVDQARRVLDEMKERSKLKYVPPFEFAIVYIGLGDKDNAFESLKAAEAERFATLIYIGIDPIFAALHDDPRYTALLQRLNLPSPLPL